MLPVANGHLIAWLIPGSRLEILDGVGHLFFWERPEQSARADQRPRARKGLTCRRARRVDVAAAGSRWPASERRGGPAVVLLHGLTATRRYVVMGSRTLERSGRRVIAYDARGHGRSTPRTRRRLRLRAPRRRSAAPCSTRPGVRARGPRGRVDGRAHGRAVRARASRARRGARPDHPRVSTRRRAEERRHGALGRAGARPARGRGGRLRARL